MPNCLKCVLFILFSGITSNVLANDDRSKIRLTVKNYIDAQINVEPDLMRRALHPQMKKRTYWLDKNDQEFVMETSIETMLHVAATYNQSGDRFVKKPKIKIDIYDIDQRVASVKLTVDDWVDYMHLVKNKTGEWQIINVLWQYHETEKHRSKQ